MTGLMMAVVPYLVEIFGLGLTLFLMGLGALNLIALPAKTLAVMHVPFFETRMAHIGWGQAFKETMMGVLGALCLFGAFIILKPLFSGFAHLLHIGGLF